MSYKEGLHLKIAESNSCELVALQYQAMIDNIEDLRTDIQNGNYDDSFKLSDKIRDIMSNLIASLGSEQSEFKEKTLSLYLYINETVNNAVINKKIEDFDTVLKSLNTLRDAWYSAGLEIRKNDTSNAISSYGKSGINLNSTAGKDYGRV